MQEKEECLKIMARHVTKSKNVDKDEDLGKTVLVDKEDDGEFML